MKVLFVTHCTTMLGANRSMLQLIVELRTKGVEVTVLLPSSVYNNEQNDLTSELEKRNIPYIEAPIYRMKHPNRWKSIPYYL